MVALPKNPLIDPDEIHHALQVLMEQGQVVEVRALNAITRQSPRYRYTASGYFNNPEALVKAVADITAATGIYITLNPCKRGLITRANNRIRTSDDMRVDARTSKDNEILCYHWLPVDIDPMRQDGVTTFFPPKIPAKAPGRSRTGLNEASSPVAEEQRKQYDQPFSPKK